ncbi:hypothetical protein C2G38_2244237 [Gigaspora rosea]|uniref:Protein kinase domain-containing protein n=1 Tax=Gigaspora rosea TaxID=44941 RepID=A0A397VGM5_9GLOM|nr:hypothetical protein C2G38_2244237 [Gigaspora rosea]
MNQSSELERWMDNKFFERNYNRFSPYDSFKNGKIDDTMLSIKSCKLFLVRCNKTVDLCNFTFSQQYELEYFINDLKQYQKVELHKNILKFIAIIKQSANEYIFIHEYTYDGTLRQYLKQNFKKINWNDKLNIAKQLVNAVKCLHENDIVHMNLNSKKIFIHRGILKISVFQYQNEPSNKFKYIQYIDPQHLQNLETYKLNKSSDIYSIGVLLWEISSGVIPFKSNLSLHYNLLNAIICGKREVTIIGTPKKYMKIYTECWQHNSNLRPTIQRIFEDLNNIDYKDTINNEDDHEKDKLIIVDTEVLSELDLLKNLYNKTKKEVELISSVVKILKKAAEVDNSFNDQNNILSDSLFASSNPKVQDYFSNEYKFIYDLNQFFITQFNIQGGLEKSKNSIAYNINQYLNDNNKNHNEIFDQYYNNYYKYCFTSIIGFIYEYGIGTTIDFHKAFEIYNQASDEVYFTANYPLKDLDHFLQVNYLMKENRTIGLISLGLLYMDGKGITVNQQKALKLFLKSVSMGSNLGKCFVGNYFYHHRDVKNCINSFDWLLKPAEEGNALAQLLVGNCYYNGIHNDKKKAFDWYLKSAENGNANAQLMIGNFYRYGIGISVNQRKAFKWYLKSAEGGNSSGQNNLGDCYRYGIGISIKEKMAFKWYMKSAEGGDSLGQSNLGYCYQIGMGTYVSRNKAFELYLKSAEAGNSSGQNLLGVCYQCGIGTSKDVKKAFEYYKKSALGGCNLGIRNLSYCYRFGIGTPVDENKVKELLDKVHDRNQITYSDPSFIIHETS